jgi:hypothetical protein
VIIIFSDNQGQSRPLAEAILYLSASSPPPSLS